MNLYNMNYIKTNSLIRAALNSLLNLKKLNFIKIFFYHHLAQVTCLLVSLEFLRLLVIEYNSFAVLFACKR